MSPAPTASVAATYSAWLAHATSGGPDPRPVLGSGGGRGRESDGVVTGIVEEDEALSSLWPHFLRQYERRYCRKINDGYKGVDV